MGRRKKEQPPTVKEVLAKQASPVGCCEDWANAKGGCDCLTRAKARETAGQAAGTSGRKRHAAGPHPKYGTVPEVAKYLYMGQRNIHDLIGDGMLEALRYKSDKRERATVRVLWESVFKLEKDCNTLEARKRGRR